MKPKSSTEHLSPDGGLAITARPSGKRGAQQGKAAPLCPGGPRPWTVGCSSPGPLGFDKLIPVCPGLSGFCY